MNLKLSLIERMETQYGPVMSGKKLRTALGFKSYAAFYRSLQLNEIGVKLFRLTGRQGWFAKTSDVANWIEEQQSQEDAE